MPTIRGLASAPRTTSSPTPQPHRAGSWRSNVPGQRHATPTLVYRPIPSVGGGRRQRPHPHELRGLLDPLQRPRLHHDQAARRTAGWRGSPRPTTTRRSTTTTRTWWARSATRRRIDGYIDTLQIGTLAPQASAVMPGGQMYQLSSGSGQGEVFVNAKWMMNLNGLYQLPWNMELAANLYGKQGSAAAARRARRHSGSTAATTSCWSRRRSTTSGCDNVWNLDLRLAKNFTRRPRPTLNLSPPTCSTSSTTTSSCSATGSSARRTIS